MSAIAATAIRGSSEPDNGSWQQSQAELARQQFQRSSQRQVRVLPKLAIKARIVMRIHAALESFGCL